MEAKSLAILVLVLAAVLCFIAAAALSIVTDRVRVVAVGLACLSAAVLLSRF